MVPLSRNSIISVGVYANNKRIKKKRKKRKHGWWKLSHLTWLPIAFDYGFIIHARHCGACEASGRRRIKFSLRFGNCRPFLDETEAFFRTRKFILNFCSHGRIIGSFQPVLKIGRSGPCCRKTLAGKEFDNRNKCCWKLLCLYMCFSGQHSLVLYTLRLGSTG